MQGFYKVSFSTVFGFGNGVVYLSDGTLHGGDSMLFYTGSYQMEGDKLRVALHIDKHTDDTSMFSIMGVETIDFDILGEIESGTIRGEISLPGGFDLRITMTPIQA